jgi:hypothetical protein
MIMGLGDNIFDRVKNAKKYSDPRIMSNNIVERAKALAQDMVKVVSPSSSAPPPPPKTSNVTGNNIAARFRNAFTSSSAPPPPPGSTVSAATVAAAQQVANQTGYGTNPLTQQPLTSNPNPVPSGSGDGYGGANPLAPQALDTAGQSASTDAAATDATPDASATPATDWWGNQSTLTKGAIIGGGLVAAVIGYKLLFGGSSATASKS